MTRQRINLHIGRVTVTGGQLSEQALSEAIRAELVMRLHGLGGVDLVPQGRAVAVLDGGEAAGGEGGDLSGGVGQAIGRATAGVLKP